MKSHELRKKNMPTPHMEVVHKADTCHLYDLTLDLDKLGDLIGRLLIEWGRGRTDAR